MAGSSFTWLGWYTLQTHLCQTLPNSVCLHLNHCLIDFSAEQLDAPIRLKFQNQPDKSVRILVGVDGYRSVVRNKMVGDGAPLYTGTMTWRGTTPRQKLAPLAEPFIEGAGFQLVVGEQKNFWIMDVGAEQLAWGGTALYPNADGSESALATVLQVFDQWTPIVERLIRATDPTSIIEMGVFDREPVSQWGDGQRITLLGDAAHPIRPSLGLGTTLAFQDAVMLAQVLEEVDLENVSAVSEAFLTLGMARLQRRGSIALIILPLALLLALISPLITLYFVVTVVITESTMFFIGNYRNKRNRLFGNVLFFSSANLCGLLLGAYLIRGAGAAAFVRFVSQPLVLLLLTVASGLAGAIGWWLGELAIKQLRKAGKIDVDV